MAARPDLRVELTSGRFRDPPPAVTVQADLDEGRPGGIGDSLKLIIPFEALLDGHGIIFLFRDDDHKMVRGFSRVETEADKLAFSADHHWQLPFPEILISSIKHDGFVKRFRGKAHES